MRVVQYHYPRALELEGRHPADAGSWPLTVRRLEVGEGLPRNDSPWALVTFAEGEAIPGTRRPPPFALWRNCYYRRIRSSAECLRHMVLDPHSPVVPAFHLTAAWANPERGMIPKPSDADPLLPLTHAAILIEPLPDQRLFHFRLLWSNWGDNGTGYMPFEYFDRYVFECWASYGRDEALKLYKRKSLGDGRVRWSAHDEEDHHIYGFEVHDTRGDERHAWAFVIERDGALEVEELYVRPEYRRMGHGQWLADRVAQLAREKGQPLRLWVGFADSKSESESNYPALVSTARRLGVQFRPCPVPWAAYFGTTEQPGEAFPIETGSIPTRPRTSRNELLAMVAALGLGNGNPGVKADPLPNTTAATAAAEVSEETFPDIGTAAWDEMNVRRAALIRKKNRGGLDPAELREYERLQRLSRAALERAFPASLKGEEELSRLMAKVNITPVHSAE